MQTEEKEQNGNRIYLIIRFFINKIRNRSQLTNLNMQCVLHASTQTKFALWKSFSAAQISNVWNAKLISYIFWQPVHKMYQLGKINIQITCSCVIVIYIVMKFVVLYGPLCIGIAIMQPYIKKVFPLLVYLNCLYYIALVISLANFVDWIKIWL